jgi:hypothetical protein
MKKLTSILNEYIEKQIGRNKTNILRVEGIDNPIIYKDICMYFKDKADDYSFIAKLTIEKYHQFIDEKKGAWKKSIEILHQGNNLEVCDDNHISDDYCNNSYIDFNGAITKWRNESANISEENKTIVILLLGTELAPDKGGLEDFCTVSPREIIDVFKKDYSSWFN